MGCCGLLRYVPNWMSCCDDGIISMRSMPENLPLMDRWVTITEKINCLEKKSKGLNKRKTVIRKMFNRNKNSYTPAEKEVLRKTSSCNPYLHPSSQVSAANSADRLARKGPSKETSRFIESEVKKKKYINGLKVADWDSIRKDVLTSIIAELKAKQFTEEQIFEAINAISDLSTRTDFRKIGI